MVMKANWFKHWGFFYKPVHPAGYMVSLSAILFMVPIFIAIDRNAHSVTDELYQIFIYLSCTMFWWKWIADKTSR